jgi:hypothetical protein
MVNAAAWWNLLQEQFKQAVTTAMTTDVATGAAAAGNPLAKADKGNLPETEDKAANGKKANGNGNGNGGTEGGGNGGKNGAAAAARKAPIKRAGSAKAGKE